MSVLLIIKKKKKKNKYVLKDSTGSASFCFVLFFSHWDMKKLEYSQQILRMLEIQESNLLQTSAVFKIGN